MGLIKSVRRWLASEVRIRIDSGNTVKLPRRKTFKKLDIRVSGHGNTVEVGCIKGHSNELKIHVYGDNNTVKIGEQKFFNANINIGYSDIPLTGASLQIGQGYGIVGAEFILMEDDSHISIGRDCIISSGVLIWCTDAHAILDREGRLINEGKSIEIGNRVWVGKDVYICKNSSIADDCIIGWKSVVTGRHAESNVILAGTPARTVKRDISWDVRRPKDYLKYYNSDEFHR